MARSLSYSLVFGKYPVKPETGLIRLAEINEVWAGLLQADRHPWRSKHFRMVMRLKREYESRGFLVEADCPGCRLPPRLMGRRPDLLVYDRYERIHRIIEVETAAGCTSLKSLRRYKELQRFGPVQVAVPELPGKDNEHLLQLRFMLLLAGLADVEQHAVPVR